MPQFTQLVAPLKGIKVPALQATQSAEAVAAPRAEPEVPAGQVVHEVAPTVTEKVPGAQAAQLVAPTETEYAPAPQLVQRAVPALAA
jgi:hypothetical protein